MHGTPDAPDFSEARHVFTGLDRARITAAGFRSAVPFPHACLDGLVDERLLEGVLAEFPGPDHPGWRVLEREGYSFRKQVSQDAEHHGGPATARLFAALKSPTFLRFLESITGIAGLIPDPYMGAGGLHQILPGGFLEMHTDFSWFGRLRLYRRLNVLVYLNRDWPKEYAGELQLRAADGATTSYLPEWNRTIVVEVSARALHGLPEPVRCPEGRSRKLVAAWYYTSDLPLELQVGYDMRPSDFQARSARARSWLPPVLHRSSSDSVRRLTGSDVAYVVSRFVPPRLTRFLLRLRRRTA